MPESKDGVRMPSKRGISWRVEQNFRDREGWCVVATIHDAYNAPLDYECTKQFSTAQGAMDAFAGFLRRMTVENQAE